MFFHYCHCHNWYYLKDCLVRAQVRNLEVDISKKCSLPAQVWYSVTIIIHLFLLDDFIFEASHEECDVTKFNQLNGASWILPGELTSVLCVCEYLSKPFIRITTVKGVTTIEGIETMFCLCSSLIIFTKQPTNSGLKIQKWLD